MAEKFLSIKYKLEKSENFDEYMKELGMYTETMMLDILNCAL